MSKKMMLLALAVVSAAFLALPALASAQEIHSEPGEAFSVSGAGGELRAEGEPTITCSGTGGEGKFNGGSSTTGSSTLDFTGCHTTVFGFTAACKSEGSEVNNTIANTGTFHLIKYVEKVTKNEKGEIIAVDTNPAVLITTNTTVIVCAGISKITVTGSVIGTMSQKCGESSKENTLTFSATGTAQDDSTYTGASYVLQSKTGSGEEKASALVGSATNTSAKAQTLNCT